MPKITTYITIKKPRQVPLYYQTYKTTHTTSKTTYPFLEAHRLGIFLIHVPAVLPHLPKKRAGCSLPSGL